LVNLVISFGARRAIPLLQKMNEPIPMKLDLWEVVLGKLTPFLLGLAFDVVPSSCETMLVHDPPPLPA